LLRQEGYKKFRALRIGSEVFNPDEKAIIVKYFSGTDKEALVDKFGGDVNKMPDKIKAMFEKMSDIAVGNDVKKQLLESPKFEDVYARTLLVDDAFLDLLEKQPEGITPLSGVWTSEVAGDGLVRNFKDTEHAINAHNALLKFIKEVDGTKKSEQAIIFAEETSQYNGQVSRAECIRYTIGSFLGMSEKGYWWDVLGVSKLPFRKAMSEVERIYGPAAKPLGQDDLRLAIDNIRTYLISAGTKPEEVKNHLGELEKFLHITGKDKAKKSAARFLVFLILAVLVEGGQLGISAVKEK